MSPDEPQYGQQPSSRRQPAYREPEFGQRAPAPSLQIGLPAPSRGGHPELAHWGPRVVAWVIDVLAADLVLIITSIYALSTAIIGVDSAGLPTNTPTVSGALGIVLGGGLAIGIWIWNRALRQGRTGQSIGKSALGLRLIGMSSGQPVGSSLAVGRDFAHLIDSAGCLGYLWPLWDARKQTVADKICGTVVLRG